LCCSRVVDAAAVAAATGAIVADAVADDKWKW